MIQNLIDITDKLVIKSKESILQLDLKLQQKKRNQEIYYSNNNDDDKDNTDIDSDNDEYVLFIAQLNSLHIRSKYIRDKLKSSNGLNKSNATTSLIIDNPNEYVKHLVYEYKDITNKLNTFARNNLTISDSISNNSKSPSSQSSNESFQPKPLRIYSRQRDSLLLESFNVTSTSPIGESSITNNTYATSITGYDRRLSCHNSLPNSPIKQICQQHNSFNTLTDKFLRSSKSYNDGLNPNKIIDKRKKKRSKEEDEYQKLFKQKNRLSLSLVGYEQDIEQNLTSTTKNDPQASFINANIVSDYESDQDTIMQCNSPLFDNYSKKQLIQQEEPEIFEPLRRYNSHESILSTKNSMLLNRKSKPLKFSLFSTNLNNPTIASSKNVQVNSNPIFASTTVNDMYSNMNHVHSTLHHSTSQKMRSTDLLQSVMKDMNNNSTENALKYKHENKPKTKTSFFDNWNVFNKYSMTLTSEVAKNDLNNINSINSTKANHIQTFRKQLSDDTVVISTIISSKPNSKSKLQRINNNNIHSISQHNNSNENTKKYSYTNPQNGMIENQRNVKFSDLHDALDTELIL